MRWKTTVWLSAALVVATSALHLNIEHDLLGTQDKGTNGDFKTTPETTSTIPSDQYEPDPDDYVVRSEENNGEETELTPSEEPTSTSPDEFVTETIIINSRSKESTNPDDDLTNPSTSKDIENGGASNGDVVGVPDGEGVPSSEDNGTDGADDGGETGGGGGADGGGGSDNGDSNGGTDGDDKVEPEGDKDTDEEDDKTVVHTTSGAIRGYPWREDKNIISYIDIPYGVFANVFEAPVQPTPLKDVHSVKAHSKRCPQIQDNLYVGNTDCLTLSIFKPLNADNASVLFHIHEGNFKKGSGNPDIYGPEYLVSKDIILVLPNYRLGPLGFLCLQNTTAPGNAALKDLTLALKWTHNNIENFGGNPANIAVSGDGTAGALAGYLALSPKSKDLVSKVITESGSVLSYWALDRSPIVTADNLVTLINELKTWQDVEAVVKAGENVSFRPCLETSNEDSFMTETPWAMITNQNISTTFIIGSAMYAGAHDFLDHTETSIQHLNEDFGRLLPNDLQFATSEEKTLAGNKVKTQYFNESEISLNDVEPLALYLTDSAYLSPGIRTARSLVNSGATVYFYEFSFVGELNRELDSIENPVKGAVKGDIVGYLFTQDGVVPKEETKERLMVDQLIELWTAFLDTGTPTSENIVWKNLESAIDANEGWLSINEETSLETGLHLSRLRLWTDIYDKHFIERNLAFGISPSVYTVLILQIIFLLSFFRNASHFTH